MIENILIFRKYGIYKNAFHKHKYLIDIDKVDIQRIVI